MFEDDHHPHQYGFLTEDRIEEAALLLSNAFLTMNKIWMMLNVPKEDADAVMLHRVTKAYRNQLSVVFFPLYR